MYDERYNSTDLGMYDDYAPFEKEESTDGLFSPFTYLCFVLFLALFGLATLFSSSYDVAIREGLKFYTLFYKQAFSLVISVLVGIALFFVPLNVLKKLYFLTYPVYLVLFGLFFFLPSLLFFYTLKSTFALLGVISLTFFLSDVVTIIKERERMGILLIFTLLITLFTLISETYISGLGWYLLSSIVIISILIATRARKSYIIFFSVALFVLLTFLTLGITHLFYSLSKSIMPISSSEYYSEDLYFSSLAIKEGGVSGIGVGNGLYKLGLISNIEGEYIFASLSEEIGVIGLLLILFCALMILIVGLRSSSRAYKKGEKYLSTLLSSLIVFFVFSLLINMLYVSGLLPFEGVPLFLFSYNPVCEGLIVIILLLLYKFIYRLGRSKER